MTPESTESELEFTEARIRQEQLYESVGFSTAAVTAKLEQGGWKDVDKEGSYTEFMLWPGFSDSIKNLDKLDFTGKRVLTVAGSGEFSQTFINRGSNRVDLFDRSMAACFFNELKLIAARELPYREYIYFFSTIAPGYGGTIFDQAKFGKLEPFLTTQAQTYFRQITTVPEYRELLFKPDSSVDGHVQRRLTAVLHTDMVSFLASEEDYVGMQERLRHASWSVRITDTNSPDLHVHDYDFVYISNISFGYQARIVDQLLRRGAKRVGFTFGGRGGGIDLPLKEYLNLGIDTRTGEIVHYDGGFLRRDLFWPVYEYNSELARRYGLAPAHEKPTLLIPGASFVYGNIRFKIIGIDTEVDVPYLIEAELVNEQQD